MFVRTTIRQLLLGCCLALSLVTRQLALFFSFLSFSFSFLETMTINHYRSLSLFLSFCFVCRRVCCISGCSLLTYLLTRLGSYHITSYHVTAHDYDDDDDGEHKHKHISRMNNFCYARSLEIEDARNSNG